MKVLVVLHGMPPQAGRSVVGSGLRAFSNGEALRGRGHQVLYCTRAEDLPEEARAEAVSRRAKKPLLLTTITGEFHPPGDARRMRRRLTAVGQAPTAEEPDAPRASLEIGDHAHGVTDPGLPRVSPGTGNGLAAVGGPLGAPGNPFSFTEAHELHEIVQRVDPDVVLVEALEEARRLPEGRFSVVLDLFAPRILEQQFQATDDEREAVRVLDAIQRGDAFVFSNQRQKYFHLPLLALAGVDCTREAGAVVPISCPPELPTHVAPVEPTFVAGGVFWPWADLSNGLASLLSILEARDTGRLHLYGGEYGIRSDTAKYADPRQSLPAEHPRLSFRGMVPIDQLWEEYRRGSIAFDLMRPNPERELNLSFRQVDYLRCGLPIITSPSQVIADDLLDYGAGWVVEPGNTRALRRLVDDLLDHPDKVAAASAQAQKLAQERYAWDRTIEPLDRLVRHPTRRAREETFVARLTRTQGDLWEEHEENQRLREVVGHQRSDLDKKTEEIAGLNARISALMGSVDRLSDSLGAVSRFKNDAVAYLQEQHGESLRDVGEASLELERRSLDLKKKQDALVRAQGEIAKLKQSVAELRSDNEHLEARFVARDREALGFEEDRKRAVGETAGLRDRIAALRQDLDKKDAEHADQRALRADELADLRERLESAVSAGATSSAEADALLGELEELRAALASARAEDAKTSRELQRVKEAGTRQQAQAMQALDALRQDALDRLEQAEEAARGVAEQLRDRLVAVERERSRLQGDLAEARHRVADLERDGAKKTAALAEGARERQRLEAGFLRSLDAAEGAARELLERARDRIGGLEDERGALKARLEEIGQRATDAQREIRAREAALARQQSTAQAAEAQAQSAALQAEEQADRRLQAVKETASAEVLELRAAAEQARRTRDAVGVQLEQARGRLVDLESDLAKKDAALARAGAERERLQAEFLSALDRAEAGASGLLERARDAAARLEAERGALRAGLQEARGRVQELEREVSVVRSTLDRERAAAAEAHGRLEAESQRALQRQEQAALAERTRLEAAALQADALADRRLQDAKESALGQLVEARSVAEEARRGRDQLLAQLQQARARLVDVESDLAKKDEALATLAASMERSQREVASQQAAEAQRAQALLEEARDHSAALDDERGTLLARVERAEFEAREALRQLRTKSQGLDEAQRERERLEHQFLAALESAEERAVVTVEELRGRLNSLALDRATLNQQLRDTASRLAEQQRQVAARDGELLEIQRAAAEAEARWEAEREAVRAEAEERVRSAHLRMVEARQQSDAARAELDRVQALAVDLQADVGKKTLALDEAQRERERLQEEFLGNLERAQGASQQVLEDAQSRVQALADQRERLQGLAEGLKREAARLGRDVSAKDTALLSAKQRLEQERSAYEQALLELEELRARSRNSDSRVIEAEAALQRQQSALESLSGELARVTGQLEMAQYEVQSVQTELDKKTLEIEQAQLQRDAAWSTAAAQREGLEAQLTSLRGERSTLTASLEQAQFDLDGLRRDALKKTTELDEAFRQRDAVTAEKMALQKALDDALETLRRSPGADSEPAEEPAEEPPTKKKPKDRRSRPRAKDAADTSAN